MREIGVDEPRCDGVARDVAGGHLARDRLGESDQAGLRRRVVRLARVAGHPGDGRNIHDAPRALPHHRTHGGLGHEERAAEIQVDDRVPVLGAHAHEQVVAGDAGVVHEDLETAAAEFECGFHDVLGLAVDGDVPLDKRRLTPALLDKTLGLRGGLSVSLVVDGDAGAVACEPDRGGAPDPAARAGDERGPSFESHVLPKLAGTPSRRAAPWATGAPSA